MFNHFALVGIGGAIGAMLRHGVGLAMLRQFGPSFPWGTLAVNVIGGFLLGILTAWFAARGGDEAMRMLLGVGVLGGFTTFSAFSLDVVNMLGRGTFGIAALYVCASVVASIGALFLGRTLI